MKDIHRLEIDHLLDAGEFDAAADARVVSDFETAIAGGSRANCIGCGCSDLQACPETCWWLAVNYNTGRGVCSNCPDHLARFRAGDMEIGANMVDCPRCGALHADDEGFGFIFCDACGNCSHPSAMNGICIACGEKV